MKYIRVGLIVFFLSILGCKAYYEAPVDITSMSIYEIQEAVDKGYLNYKLIVNLYLDRINAYDSNYKAMISINQDAIKEAEACDLEYQKNGRSNILFCIPIIVKDNIDVKGMATTAGSKGLADNYPNEDAYVIKKLKEKGMIILGKSNMSFFAMSASNSVSYYGAVHNAYNLNKSSYGSSGGSAVAVSLSYAPVALGTDTNSSLRAPASANNVIGFRSTLGLIDTKGIIAYDITRDVVGPITRNTTDSALLMSALTGNDYSIKGNLEGKVIGVIDQFKDDSDINNLVNQAIKKMEDKGAKIVHLSNFWSSTYENVGNSTLGGWTMCSAFNSYIKNTTGTIKNFYQMASAKNNTYSLWNNYNKCDMSLSYTNTMEKNKTSYREYVNKVFKDNKLDAIIYPTMTSKVVGVTETTSSIKSSKIASVLGLPAVAVPMGFVSGLPYGLEFVSLKNNESTLYEIIKGYEEDSSYVLSSIAKPLYTVGPNVELLKTEYENTTKYEKYLKINSDLKDKYNEIKEFFSNYNEIEDKEDKAIELYNSYQQLLIESMTTINIINLISSDQVLQCLLIVLIIMIIVTSLLLIKKKKKN